MKDSKAKRFFYNLSVNQGWGWVFARCGIGITLGWLLGGLTRGLFGK